MYINYLEKHFKAIQILKDEYSLIEIVQVMNLNELKSKEIINKYLTYQKKKKG